MRPIRPVLGLITTTALALGSGSLAACGSNTHETGDAHITLAQSSGKVYVSNSPVTVVTNADGQVDNIIITVTGPASLGNWAVSFICAPGKCSKQAKANNDALRRWIVLDATGQSQAVGDITYHLMSAGTYDIKVTPPGKSTDNRNNMTATGGQLILQKPPQ